MTTQLDSKPRVLLADDEPDNIRVLAAALDDEYTLSFATSGRETLEMARSESKPDMMLVDVMMADLDGFQVCASLREDPDTADIPVIFVTALDDRINEEKGFQVGAVDYITKPISPSIVRARVRVHLELKRHRAFLERLLERRSEDLEAAQDEVRQVLGALRESEAKLRAFMDYSPQALSLKDVNGRYLMVNSVATKRMGQPVEAILGQTNWDLGRWDGATRRAVDAHERSVIGSRTAVSQERTEIEGDGSAYLLLVTRFPVFDDNGRVVAVGTSNTDITELKVTERALGESRERFRDFAEASSDWFWETGPDLRLKYLSEKDSRLLNVSVVERLNLTREAGGNRGDVAEHPEKWNLLWESLEARRAFRNFEFPVEEDERRTRYIRASGQPLNDDNGIFCGYRGVASDVTEVLESQHQAEALRNAINVSDDAVVLYNGDQRVVFTNDAYHRIFPEAPPKNEIVGMTRDKVTRELEISGWQDHPLAHADRDAPMDDAEKGDPDEELTVHEETSANRRTYLCRRRIFGNGQALTTFTDITQRKEIEAELRRLASEVSLAEERERRRIVAELHDGSVQKLGVSRMKLGMLCPKLADPDEAVAVEEVCNLLDRSIREMRSLMSELSSPILYELGLEPAVEWLAQRFRTRHGLDCEVALDDQAPRLSSDIEVSLFQAVRELLANVVKHARATKVSIEVQRSDSDMRIRVQDDGIGLDPNHVGKHPSDTGGFGLFSVRERLGLLGGHLQIESEQGTQITMTVPLATEDRGV